MLKLCNEANSAASQVRQRKLGLRLDQLRNAETLADLRCLPQARCHELTGDRKGTLSVDLDHPFRLIFEPADEPIPLKKDGGLDWHRVRTIRIISIEDTRG